MRFGSSHGFSNWLSFQYVLSFILRKGFFRPFGFNMFSALDTLSLDGHEVATQSLAHRARKTGHRGSLIAPWRGGAAKEGSCPELRGRPPVAVAAIASRRETP